jgi:predicted Ser/Thr protein kinase
VFDKKPKAFFSIFSRLKDSMKKDSKPNLYKEEDMEYMDNKIPREKAKDTRDSSGYTGNPMHSND